MKRLKLLFGILVLLIIAVLIVTLSENKKETGNFQSTLVKVESSAITEIAVMPSPPNESFRLIKTGEDTWEVVSGDQRYKAQNGSVNSLLSQITPLKARQIVAKSRDSWEKYNVNDSLGTTLQIKEGSTILAEITIGRMTFAQPRNPYQQQPDAFTFVRTKGDESVYSVEGMLSMAVAGGIDNFRSSVIIESNKENLTRIIFNYPADSSFTLAKADSIWRINGMEADSANTHSYLNSLRNFSNRSFASSLTPENQTITFGMEVEGNNMEAIKITAWPGEDDNYYLRTSQNERTLFKLSKAQFERLFKPSGYFLKPSI